MALLKKVFGFDVDFRLRNMDDDAHAIAKAAAALERKSLNRYILDAVDARNAAYKSRMPKPEKRRDKKMR